jgi:hypothetical protein
MQESDKELGWSTTATGYGSKMQEGEGPNRNIPPSATSVANVY